jgi:hypothetical protein
MEELIDVAKSQQLRSGFDEAAGGRVVYVHTEKGDKCLFLPKDLNSDFEDDYYHGYVVGDYRG